MEEIILSLPNTERKVLLHCCCAPCSGGIIETLLKADIAPTILFYNPNIHPQEEYEKRKEELIRFAVKKNVPFADSDYDLDTWFERVKGLEDEPERGARCSVCFDMRLERSALFAHENGFAVFTSNLGISRFKDMDQVNAAGLHAASRYPGLIYWTYNWRSGNGMTLMRQVAKNENFYRQKYCGCVYSRRDTSSCKSDTPKIPDIAAKT
ncbi:MAG: epoxyqueuosine reductase QueH [Candidatus Omnitrophica bacterium]|nr:epoxyqueuosine reductase QueH [Candidatus Omnitrophota bacterium]